MRNGLYIIGIYLALLGCGGGSSGSNPGSTSGGPSNQNSITFTWDPPTLNVDGTPLEDLAGYKVHYGTAPGVYSDVVDIGLSDTPDAPEYTVTDLEQGTTYYFSTTAYNISGNESEFSNETSKTIF